VNQPSINSEFKNFDKFGKLFSITSDLTPRRKFSAKRQLEDLENFISKF